MIDSMLLVYDSRSFFWIACFRTLNFSLRLGLGLFCFISAYTCNLSLLFIYRLLLGLDFFRLTKYVGIYLTIFFLSFLLERF